MRAEREFVKNTQMQQIVESRNRVPVRAGFSQSRALFRKKCGGRSLIYEYRPTEFTWHTQWQCCHHRHFVKDSHNIIICTQKRLDTKMPARHTKSFFYYFNYFQHIAMLQKFAGPLVGPLFCGAPVPPNMLNMPKSASGSGTS